MVELTHKSSDVMALFENDAARIYVCRLTNDDRWPLPVVWGVETAHVIGITRYEKRTGLLRTDIEGLCNTIRASLDVKDVLRLPPGVTDWYYPDSGGFFFRCVPDWNDFFTVSWGFFTAITEKEPREKAIEISLGVPVKRVTLERELSRLKKVLL